MSLASLKQYPGDLDHMDVISGKEHMELSPSMMSMGTVKTGLGQEDGISLRSQGGVIQPGNFQREGSVHSLRMLGLQAVPPPVPGHAPTFAPIASSTVIYCDLLYENVILCYWLKLIMIFCIVQF